MARILPTDRAIEDAVTLLRGGHVVAIPTETVYGLAADATNGQAVARIFETKGRPRFNPLICHVSTREMAERLAVFDTTAGKLADRFWPGPLTLVLPLRENSPVHPLVSAGLQTIALRMPQGFAAELIARLGEPLAAPSANSSGRISATSADAVQSDLGDRIELIVDGGPSRIGLESTIVKIDDGRPRLLRPGGVPVEEIEAVLGMPMESGVAGKIQAPGMMTSHYAPATPLRLNANHIGPDEALLAFGPVRAAGADLAKAVANLSPTGDLRDAAANLYACLHQLDAVGASMIAAEPVPNHDLGAAINDRLSRAAAPRDTETRTLS